MKPMSQEQASEVYDILVEHCGAPESWRDNFMYHQTASVCEEYRFQGCLGFGGKFRRYNRGSGLERWYVDQYHEDTTDRSKKVIETANDLLADLRKEYE